MHRRSRWFRFRQSAHRCGWLGGPLIFVLTTALFSWLLIDPTFADPDSFYHAGIAKLMSHQGILTDFPYLRYTYLYEHFTDHHLLYHLFLVPFVKWLPMFVGAKVATVFLAGIFFLVWFYLARNLGGWLPSLAAGLMLATRPFDFRLGLTKASALALLLLFVGFWLMVKKRYVWLFLLSFVYAWAHGGFAVLWVVCGLTGLCLWLTEHKQAVKGVFTAHHRWKSISILWRTGWRQVIGPAALSVLGSVSGTVCNPYFPNNLRFLWQQLIQIGVVNYQEVITVGAEWYPYQWYNLVPDTALLGIALIGTGMLCVAFWRRLNGVTWAAVVMTVFFFVLTLKSRRFIEYAVPWGWLAFTLVLGATEFRAWLEQRWTKIWKFFTASKLHVVMSVLLAVYFVVMIPAIAVKGVIDNKQQFSNSMSWSQWQGATTWLEQNTPFGALVFHDDWDGFPILFAQNPHNIYIIGLDPTFMYLYDQDKYWKYVRVTTGKEEGQLAQIIGEDFGAKYVFVATDHTKLQNQLRRDQAFEEVYKDDEASVFLLK